MASLTFGKDPEPRFKSAPKQEEVAADQNGFVNQTLDQMSGVLEAGSAPVQAHLVELHSSGGTLAFVYGLIVFATTALVVRQLQKHTLRKRKARFGESEPVDSQSAA